jgi:hypothetical protein
MEEVKEKYWFVAEDSVVRRIWGSADIILFIFAGAAAEFALNKAVDWLYFTGKLPADPLGRLFTTVGYAKRIVFSTTAEANKTIDTIQHIHNAVESARGATIPDWAYRDVLFMLIHYSIASFELFEHRLSDVEKEEIYNVFYRVGKRMGQKELPDEYAAWLPVRAAHLEADLGHSEYTDHLFQQYKKHLGGFRFRILIEGQKLVVPPRVKQLLQFSRFSFLTPAIPIYRFSRMLKIDWLLKNLLLPGQYKKQIRELDIVMQSTDHRRIGAVKKD